MSGIFGFSYRMADREKLEEASGALEYWNRLYGRSGVCCAVDGTSGYGCHIEHFSDVFPAPASLLTYRDCPAVVDALLFNRDELLPMVLLPADSPISDEELLLKLIECRGFEALKQVNGDFAGGIYDREEKTWTLFRDHMGVRPLFYYMDRDTLVFSTDIRGIVAAPDVDSRFSEEHLYRSLLLSTTITPDRTQFQHIRCVMPGSVTRFTMTDTQVRRRETLYWRPRQKKLRLSSDEAYRAELRRLVTDAVNRRCDAIPGLLGAELSGGLDSCIIDILISRHGREEICYSWSPPPEHLPLQEGEDERKVILDVCAQENLTCRFMHRQDEFDFMFMLTQYMPPYINAPHLAFGSKWMKSQGANVVFSGYGGDEGVSHRCSPFELFYNGEFAAYFRIYRKYLEGKPFASLRALRSGMIDAWNRLRKLKPRLTEESLSVPVLKKEFNDRMKREFRLIPLEFNYAPHRYVRQGGTRPRLDNGAFMGAYSGVRYLYPYVDHRVMDFALSIPRRLHVNHATSRLIFRETFDDLMPQSLREVFYKDMASVRNRDRSGYANLSFHHNLDWLLRNLDRDIWGDVIDFEKMKRLHDFDILDNRDIGVYTRLMHKMNDCVAIQNIQKNAKRWREFDAENKIL